MLKVVSFDPSLSNWGIAYCSYTPNYLSIDKVSIIQTKPLKKSKLSKSLQDMSRILTLHEGVLKAIEDCDVVVAELPTGSQSARAMMSYGVCLALVTAIDKPLITVTPSQVKKVVGAHTTSKEEIIDWVNFNHPNVLDKAKTRSEHQADAVVAIYAAKDQLKAFYAEFTATQ